jgi:primosomal protein N' (replication factor Y)
MFYLVKVLIGRAVVSLDRPFDYWTDLATLHQGMRVIVSFGSSKSTIGFILEEPKPIEENLEDYEKREGIRLSKIQRAVDDSPLLDERLLSLAHEVSAYYKSDLIKVLGAFLPPSLKPKDSALKKPQSKTADFAFALPLSGKDPLSKNEKALYEKIQKEADGIRTVHISAKASLEKLLQKKAVEIRAIPVYRIPEIEAKHFIDFDLTLEQEAAYQHILSTPKDVFLLEGVTGSGKTEVYIRLAEKYVKDGKGVLILVPEIALTDHMADLFASYFQDTISIIHSSLSDARKYDEYRRIANGETKVVLGTRSAVFAPVRDLGLIIIDEEHSSAYKQDNDPFYDAIEVGKMRAVHEKAKLVLGSATPRVIDKARAEKGIYEPVYLKTRYAKNQDRDLIVVNMNDSSALDPNLSALFSKRLLDEIKINLEKKEQTMVLINRRGYSPIYLCRKCHHSALCPNCNIPLNYHKREDVLRCHHCGYEINVHQYTCPCGSKDFLTIGYGTERAYEDLRLLFPTARITRLDSDVSSHNVRHEVLDSFAAGDTDILIGTEIIAKGHDFPKVTLAAILDADTSLRLPTYLASEEAFDLISQFVGRAGRADKKGRVLIQTYVPDNPVIRLASAQDYEAFYAAEMEERRKYKYPPYTYLTSLIIKAVSNQRCEDVAYRVKNYLVQAIGDKRFDLLGPSLPYIPHINGRYYRNILLKYKSWDEASPILDGIKTIRLANRDVEIEINVDPETEGI